MPHRVVVPFTLAHLPAAADLLAARHRADREREPWLCAAFEHAEATRARVEAALHTRRSLGVAAMDRQQLVGFLIGERRLGVEWLRPRAAAVRYDGYAAAPAPYEAEQADIYRDLYAALAPRWLADGSTSHYITASPSDGAAMAAWRSLGFGQEAVYALRRTTAPERHDSHAPLPSAISITRGTPDDLVEVAELSRGLIRYHSGPPILFPALPEVLEQSDRLHAADLADESAMYWLARREGRVVGMQAFVPPRASFSPLLSPERCIYLSEAFIEPQERAGGLGSALLAHALAWARSAGYDWCSVSWDTANLSGARFWTGAGFRPLSVRLARHLDERIFWSAGELISPRRHGGTEGKRRTKRGLESTRLPHYSCTRFPCSLRASVPPW